MKDGVKVIVLSGLTVALLARAGQVIITKIKEKREAELLEDAELTTPFMED